MSLVNQVLKDLQKNHQQSKPQQLYLPVEDSPIKKIPPAFHLSMAVMLLISAAIFSYLYLKPAEAARASSTTVLVNPKPGNTDNNNLLLKNSFLPLLIKEPTYAKEKSTTEKPIPEKAIAAEKPVDLPEKQSGTKQPNKALTGKKVAEKAVVKSHSKNTRLTWQLAEITNNANAYNYSHTKKSLQLLLEEEPEFHAARQYLIQLCWKNADLYLEQLLSESVSNYPYEAAYRLSASRYYLQKQQLPLAIKFLTDLPENLMLDKTILQTRAIIRQKQKQHQLAIRDYQTLIKNYSTGGDIYLALGISFEALGESRLAIKSYRKAVADPDLSSKQRHFLTAKLDSFVIAEED